MANIDEILSLAEAEGLPVFRLTTPSNNTSKWIEKKVIIFEKSEYTELAEIFSKKIND